MSSNLTVLIININSTWTVLLLKLNIGCERFYLCRLFTIDLFKPKIVTGQYNSRTGISNVIIPGGHCKWSLNRKNSEKYWISNIKRNLVLKYNIYIYIYIYMCICMKFNFTYHSRNKLFFLSTHIWAFF
jgi:hypothetical protein